MTKAPKVSDKQVDLNAPHQTVACEVCLKEIPATLAKTFDAPDYVLYFCGLDCLGKWEEQNGLRPADSTGNGGESDTPGGKP